MKLIVTFEATLKSGNGQKQPVLELGRCLEARLADETLRRIVDEAKLEGGYDPGPPLERST